MYDGSDSKGTNVSRKTVQKIPPRFQTSVPTLHRIHRCVRDGVTRRSGTVLLMTPSNGPSRVLIANDVSAPCKELGKPFGAVSLPMGFSRRNESQSDSILRVLQQEVFADHTVERRFPFDVSEGSVTYVGSVRIADVLVNAYHFPLSEQFSQISMFSSWKMTDHRFESLELLSNQFVDSGVRAGIAEGIQLFLQHEFGVSESLIVGLQLHLTFCTL